MGVMNVLCARGDENVIRWGESQAERDIARETFNRYRDRGFTMFRMTEDEERGARMTEFDPEAEGIIAVPQMRGG